MMRLVQQKGLSWLQQHMVNFADDNHLSWQGSNEQQLYKAVNEAAEVLELLTDWGFHINFAKSVVMLRIVGQKERAFRRNHIIHSQDEMFLKCSTPRNTYRIPVVHKWDYLGAVVGYRKPATDTVERRLKAAEYAFKRLKPVIGNRRTLPMQQRLQVYDTCVVSTLSYAVFAAGFARCAVEAFNLPCTEKACFPSAWTWDASQAAIQTRARRCAMRPSASVRILHITSSIRPANCSERG